jgi:hypothetical protein
VAEPWNHGIYDRLAPGWSLSPLPPPARPPRHGARYASAAQGLRNHRAQSPPLRGTGRGDFYRSCACVGCLVGRFVWEWQIRGGVVGESADVDRFGGSHHDFCAVGDLGIDVDESRGVWKGAGWVAEEYFGFGGDLRVGILNDYTLGLHIVLRWKSMKLIFQTSSMIYTRLCVVCLFFNQIFCIFPFGEIEFDFKIYRSNGIISEVLPLLIK